MNIPKVLDSEEVYKGKIISIRKDTLTRGDGKKFIRETAVSSDAVAVVAMDEQSRILLIRQYRHPMKQPVWEIPAGKMDVDGERPEETAIRELQEETDTTAESVELLTLFYNSVGWTNEKTYVYLVKNLREVPEFKRENEEADIEKKWIALDEAYDLVRTGELADAKTVIGILLTFEKEKSHFASITG